MVVLIPQFKVNKAKLLYAEYYALQNTIKGLVTGENIQKKFIGNEEANIDDYCIGL